MDWQAPRAAVIPMTAEQAVEYGIVNEIFRRDDTENKRLETAQFERV